MSRLRRNAWWGLVAMAVIIVLFGVGDVFNGIDADPAIAVGLTGLTPAEVRAESEAAHRIIDINARTGGVHLIVIGALMLAVLFAGFRRNQRWAWWAMWTLPGWTAAVSVIFAAYGVAPGQIPPPPMLSGPIFAVVSGAILLLSAPRFFGDQTAIPVRAAQVR
jgi:hypothetical protein